MPEALTIPVEHDLVVSALFQTPPHPTACYVMAHGAGAGMHHRFLSAAAAGLESRGIATLRYQFPFMERGSKRPDGAPLAHATVRAAVQAAARLAPSLTLIAGGKSFGGRMTSQAQAASPLAGVRGLAFLGFPLHPAAKPSDQRAEHLAQVDIPMLFLQGTRDALADVPLLERVIERQGDRATLAISEGADHAFHVPARSGKTDNQILDDLLDTFAGWAVRLG